MSGQEQGERRRFAGLLAAQIGFVFVIPFVSDEGAGGWFLRLAVVAILLAGVYAASNRRGMLRAALILLLPALFAWLGPDFMSRKADEILRMLSASLCFSLTAVVVVRALLRQQNVSADTILGGINVYLLIALAFMFLHIGVALADGGAYAMSGAPLIEQLRDDPDSRGFATLLYFSFTTLTTLGYGDIVPVNAFARLLTSAEAVLGQLYVAIFIGRLVALQVSAQPRFERS
jgi:hypothetical protein